MTNDQGTWTLAEESTITMKTSRIGLMALHAKAPVVGGTAVIADGEVTLEFVVAIDKVSTGNPLLDPEVHALVSNGSDGTLTFTGTGANLAEVNGHAKAGNITVPLELVAAPKADPVGHEGPIEVALQGRTSFQDLHLPLPGLGHIKHIDIDISGLITLMRKTAEAS